MPQNNGKEWIIRILIATATLAIGFGASQLSLGAQVKVNTEKNTGIEKRLDRIENKIDKLILELNK